MLQKLMVHLGLEAAAGEAAAKEAEATTEDLSDDFCHASGSGVNTQRGWLSKLWSLFGYPKY